MSGAGTSAANQSTNTLWVQALSYFDISGAGTTAANQATNTLWSKALSYFDVSGAGTTAANQATNTLWSKALSYFDISGAGTTAANQATNVLLSGINSTYSQGTTFPTTVAGNPVVPNFFSPTNCDLVITNASFTFGNPIGATAGAVNYALLLVTNYGGSTIGTFPAAAWTFSGTTNCTNVTAVYLWTMPYATTDAVFTPVK
jgi:hypothetical protein